MSANLVVDIGNTCQTTPSIVPQNAFPASGAIVGNVVDLLYTDTNCNVLVNGGLTQSGQLRIAVQTSDSTTSGSFTDPTSGLPQMPSSLSSGGVLFVNSGGGSLQSGFMQAAHFVRNGRYTRAIALSGDFFQANLAVTFLSQLKVTGSGGGFTFSPSSGTVSV